MACVFLSMMTFNAVMYVREDLRFELFGFETAWVYVCIVAELLILCILGCLSVNSYSLYCLEEEGIQNEAERKWLHQLEVERAAVLLNEYRNDLKNIDLDDKTRSILNGMYRIVCQIYPYVTDTSSRMKSVENTVGFISEKIPAESLRHLDRMKETMGSLHKVSCTVLANVTELESKLGSIRTGPHLGQVINAGNSISVEKELQTFRNLVSRMEKVETGFKDAMSKFKVMGKEEAKGYQRFTDKVSSVESQIAGLKESIREAQESRITESVETKLFKGQMDQLLERTEILDSYRQMLRKYAALMEASRGDIEDFLKMDDIISQPITVLNLGKDISAALVRNGFDTIESLLMHDESFISQKTRLGPKRMQRLEEALKSYSPELSFGMYQI